MAKDIRVAQVERIHGVEVLRVYPAEKVAVICCYGGPERIVHLPDCYTERKARTAVAKALLKSKLDGENDLITLRFPDKGAQRFVVKERQSESFLTDIFDESDLETAVKTRKSVSWQLAARMILKGAVLVK